MDTVEMARRWGELIRRKRGQENLNQVELARELGVRQSAISRWETGRSTPPAHMQARLIGLLAIGPEELHAIFDGHVEPVEGLAGADVRGEACA